MCWTFLSCILVCWLACACVVAEQLKHSDVQERQIATLTRLATFRHIERGKTFLVSLAPSLVDAAGLARTPPRIQVGGIQASVLNYKISYTRTSRRRCERQKRQAQPTISPSLVSFLLENCERRVRPEHGHVLCTGTKRLAFVALKERRL